MTDRRGDDRRGAREPYAARAEERGTSWISVILGLLLPFVGGAIGGAWGARTGRKRGDIAHM